MSLFTFTGPLTGRSVTIKNPFRDPTSAFRSRRVLGVLAMVGSMVAAYNGITLEAVTTSIEPHVELAKQAAAQVATWKGALFGAGGILSIFGSIMSGSSPRPF